MSAGYRSSGPLRASGARPEQASDTFQSALVKVHDPSQVGEARRCVQARCRRLGLDEATMGRAAIVATELATNLMKHAKSGGEIIVRGLQRLGQQDGSPGPDVGIEILSLDHGPGIPNLGHALSDGFSTAGTGGTGLGAISRLSSCFDLYSSTQTGTAIVAQLWPERLRPAGLPAQRGGKPELELGAICLPLQGEQVVGDAWSLHLARPGVARILVADGLGHGESAAEASHLAIELFRENPEQPPEALMKRLHEGLRRTRGAAISIAELSVADGSLKFMGVGNVWATIAAADGTSWSAVSHNGTVGAEIRKLQEFSYRWPGGSVFVMFSDGLQSRWDLAKYPGLFNRHPSLIAGVLYRDFSRGRDDVTVIVARRLSERRPCLLPSGPSGGR